MSKKAYHRNLKTAFTNFNGFCAYKTISHHCLQNVSNKRIDQLVIPSDIRILPKKCKKDWRGTKEERVDLTVFRFFRQFLFSLKHWRSSKCLATWAVRLKPRYCRRVSSDRRSMIVRQIIIFDGTWKIRKKTLAVQIPKLRFFGEN